MQQRTCSSSMKICSSLTVLKDFELGVLWIWFFPNTWNEEFFEKSKNSPTLIEYKHLHASTHLVTHISFTYIKEWKYVTMVNMNSVEVHYYNINKLPIINGCYAARSWLTLAFTYLHGRKYYIEPCSLSKSRFNWELCDVRLPWVNQHLCLYLYITFCSD